MLKKLLILILIYSELVLLILAIPKFSLNDDVDLLNNLKIKNNANNANINNNRKCGYEGCPIPKNGMLNVHLVPHTHDDVGWLKTVDQYYYGSKTLIQKAGVQYIIDSVISELLTDPEKKFIYVESAFFHKWWKEQSDDKREQVKLLVKEGRLEFIGGGWSMHDEATTHYQSIIDQFTWGLRYLNDTFGECGRPKIGWQIDPFGHSRETASLFAQMGYDGLFIGRLDYQDKNYRLNHKTPEMIWHGSANLGEKGDLFTGVLYNNYSPPPGFCFDILCSDEPIIDDIESDDYNVDARVFDFLKYVKKQAYSFKTDNIMLTMGGDFTYMDAHVYYKNMDKMIRYGNAMQNNGSDIHLMYSTPSCYLKSLHDTGLTWTSKKDDFFPYGSDPHTYWTGYFTSRPTLKRFERMGNHFLQVCKQLSALTPSKSNEFNSNLDKLRESMGIMQHHDAVTGTEKQRVAQDYARILDRAINACTQNTKNALNQLVNGHVKRKHEPVKDTFKNDGDFSFNNCLNLNISECRITESGRNFMVTLYNPLGHSTFQYVRVPVIDDRYQVKDYRGIEILSQIVPVPDPVRQLEYRQSIAMYELVFMASELPPLGYKSYFVSHGNEFQPEVIQLDEPAVESYQYEENHEHQHQHQHNHNHKSNDEITIGNKYISITFNGNGLLSSVTSDGITRNVSQNFYYYIGMFGNNNAFINRSSGAYIFRPNGTEPTMISETADIRVIRGSVVDEVHQKFSNWVSQVIRIYKDEDYVEFEWLVGPIPVHRDYSGKEIISRFTSDINSNELFYTDSNGREMIKRKRNQRDTWDLKLEESISGNYYPVTAKIAIEDDTARLAILNDRAQGGSSLNDGEIELMVHRRLLHDDAFGVGEALNEFAYGKGLIARGQHYLTLGSNKKESNKKIENNGNVQQQTTTEARERFLQLKKLLPAWPFFSNVHSMSYETWKTQFSHIYSAMTLSLPQNVHLLTFEPWHEQSILVRFEHILERFEDPLYSQSVTFNINDVFHNLDIESIRETTLAGNQWLVEATRMKFQEESTNETGGRKRKHFIKNVLNKDEPITVNKFEKLLEYSDADPMIVTLKPMEIRTYVMTMEWHP